MAPKQQMHGGGTRHPPHSPKSREPRNPQPSEVMTPSSLETYYQKRIEDFETERAELLKRVESCVLQRAEQHKLEAEARRRVDEVRELQKALSDAHTYLFEERERLLQLQAAHDDLKLQEVEDRRRIQHLLALHSPMEQEITYSRQGKPHTLTVLPRTQQGPPQPHPHPHPLRSIGRENRGPLQPQHQAAPYQQQQQEGERVMRTVYLPTANSDSLMLRIESLQAQLNEQKQFNAERVAALLEDRRIREQDEQAHAALAAQRIDELQQRLQNTERALQQATKDYILTRRDKQEAEGRAAQAASDLQQEQQRSATELRRLQAAAEEEHNKAKVSSDECMEEYTCNFREQIRQRDEDIASLQSVHAAIQGQLEGRVAELEGKLGKSQEACKQLELRRVQDAEGWSSDVTLLRKQLLAVDRKLHQMRLMHRLEDDERLDALLLELSRRAPDVPALTGSGSSISHSRALSTHSATSEVAADLKHVKTALLGMSQKANRNRRPTAR